MSTHYKFVPSTLFAKVPGSWSWEFAGRLRNNGVRTCQHFYIKNYNCRVSSTFCNKSYTYQNVHHPCCGLHRLTGCNSAWCWTNDKCALRKKTLNQKSFNPPSANWWKCPKTAGCEENSIATHPTNDSLVWGVNIFHCHCPKAVRAALRYKRLQ